MENFAFVVLGLLGLWLGTELALRSTIELAKQRGLSHGFLGLTVLAIGTDLPELVIAIQAGLSQLGGVETAGIVVGNAIGSAITQGSLVLGVAGLFGYLRLAPRMIRRDGGVLVLSIGVVAMLAADGQLDRLESGALLGVYAIYFVSLFQAERSRPEEPSKPRERGMRLVLSILGGLVLVVISAEFAVDGAVALAKLQGWDQTLVGLLLIGAGTSLPELALSLGAAAKGRTGLSVGNIIGSNIFDLLVPLGISGMIYPLSVSVSTLVIDLPFLALLTLAALVFFIRKRGLQRSEAIAMIVLYSCFAVLRILLVDSI
ncbi:MAG: calcium/sodium antiporter [bacterium]|nr:calcium/sodium antiporter [bacterium]MCP5068635.1 calcium/sodium antiporter [bacterium]